LLAVKTLATWLAIASNAAYSAEFGRRGKVCRARPVLAEITTPAEPPPLQRRKTGAQRLDGPYPNRLIDILAAVFGLFSSRGSIAYIQA